MSPRLGLVSLVLSANQGARTSDEKLGKKNQRIGPASRRPGAQGSSRALRALVRRADGRPGIGVFGTV
jgi:hypothetical protein